MNTKYFYLIKVENSWPRRGWVFASTKTEAFGIIAETYAHLSIICIEITGITEWLPGSP